MVKTANAMRDRSATYVVQVAARTGRNSDDLAGVIEDIYSGRVAHFSSTAELIRFLSGEAEAAEETER